MTQSGSCGRLLRRRASAKDVVAVEVSATRGAEHATVMTIGLPSRFQVDGIDAHGNLVAGNEGAGRLGPCSKRFRVGMEPTLINGRVTSRCPAALYA